MHIRLFKYFNYHTIKWLGKHFIIIFIGHSSKNKIILQDQCIWYLGTEEVKERETVTLAAATFPLLSGPFPCGYPAVRPLPLILELPRWSVYASPQHQPETLRWLHTEWSMNSFWDFKQSNRHSQNQSLAPSHREHRNLHGPQVFHI